MKKEDLFDMIGEVDEQKVAAAGRAMTAKKRSHSVLLKWGAMAACLCLVIAGAIRIGIAFTPSQMTDHFREGNLIEITNQDELPAEYDGKLLAFNLDFESYEFYYDMDGSAENTDDWYSLLASKRNADGSVLLHCLFGETTVDDWKVSRVFTKEATQTVTVNGVEVQIARMESSLQYEYWYYAIFEVDDVVYDVRVQSDDADCVYTVLNELLQR